MSRGHVQLNTVNAVTVPYDVKSKQAHARLVHLFLCHVFNAVHLCTKIFELAQGFTHPVHIDERSEVQFKFGVHLDCKKTWPAGAFDHQSALKTNNR